MTNKKIVAIISTLTLIIVGGLLSTMIQPISALASDTTDQSIYELPAKEGVLPQKVWTVTFKADIDPTLSSQELSNYIYVNDSNGNPVNISVAVCSVSLCCHMRFQLSLVESLPMGT